MLRIKTVLHLIPVPNDKHQQKQESSANTRELIQIYVYSCLNARILQLTVCDSFDDLEIYVPSKTILMSQGRIQADF